ncbi:MAG TPA: tetratricopeptide repeat protein, partial [Gammaproteobacteria bacterium]
AVRCAMDLQTKLHEHNLAAPERERLQIRIGIHLGDVVRQEGDLFGDTVNIAARVEPEAAPGGIAISQTVYEQIRGKFDHPLQPLGERKLKGITEKVALYAVKLPWQDGISAGPRPGLVARLRQHHMFRIASWYATAAYVLVLVANAVLPDVGYSRDDARYLIAGLALAFPVVLILSWMFIPPSRENPEHLDRWRRLRWRLGAAVSLVVIAFVTASGIYLWRLGAQHRGAASLSSAVAEAPPKSVAVLPFENLSADPNNAYFASGMQDMILTKLTDISDLKTVSRMSTERYGSHPDDVRTIGQELGVATLLEGSVQKAGNQVLISVRLIDAASGKNLWADAYTRTLDDVFGVEGGVAGQIATALDAKLTPAEAAQVTRVPTHDKAAYDAYLRGLYFLKQYDRHWDRSLLQQARDSARQAVTLDPNFTEAYVLLAHASGPDEALVATRKALALDPDDAAAHMEIAILLSTKLDNDGAMREAETAARLAPNDPEILRGLGMVLVQAGRFADGIAALQHAVSLAPNEAEPLQRLGEAFVYSRRYTDARDSFRQALALDPDSLSASIWMVDVYDFGWADLDASHKILSGIRTPIGSSFPLASSVYWHDVLARDYAGARAAIAAIPDSVLQDYEAPRGYYLGISYYLAGDRAKAKPYFLTARAELERWIKDKPDDAFLHGNLSEVLAGLGLYPQALDEARRAVALQPVSKDALAGPAFLGDLAFVELCAGDVDASITQMRALLQMPAGIELSAASLRVDPEWDPIRHDPRFQALLSEFGDAGHAPR